MLKKVAGGAMLVVGGVIALKFIGAFLGVVFSVATTLISVALVAGLIYGGWRLLQE